MIYCNNTSQSIISEQNIRRAYSVRYVQK